MAAAKSIHTRPWTEPEFQTLREHYPTLGQKATATLLGRTTRATQRMASLLGIRSTVANELRGKARRQEGPTKRCCRCHEEKAVDEFWVRRQSNRLDGTQSRLSYCAACSRKALEKWVGEHPDRMRVVRRRRFHKRAYGITEADYAAMLASQGGVCAICRQPESRKHPEGVVWVLSVDHDHRTGAIRNLLCGNCNALLGHADDDIALLETCIAYLKRHAATPSLLTSGRGQLGKWRQTKEPGEPSPGS